MSVVGFVFDRARICGAGVKILGIDGGGGGVAVVKCRGAGDAAAEREVLGREEIREAVSVVGALVLCVGGGVDGPGLKIRRMKEPALTGVGAIGD